MTRVSILCLAVALGGFNSAHAQVIPPSLPVAGQSQRFWADQWWAWAIPISPSVNPISDTTGAQAFRGDVGPIFYLAGSFSTDPISRTVTVPENKPLFFPLVNTFIDNAPPITDPPTPPTTFTPQELLDQITPLFEPSQVTVGLSINGVAQPGMINHRQTTLASAPFSYTVNSADNLINFFGFDPTNGTGVFPATVFPAVQDGYWVALEPFPVGTTNTIQITSEIAAGFSQNITYTITTVPEPTSMALVGLAGGGWWFARRFRRAQP